MRYLILVLLNVPIILAALINIITQYKLRKVSVNALSPSINYLDGYHGCADWVISSV